MGYRDLREYLEAAEKYGELKLINGAHWDLEMSSIFEIIQREGKDPKPGLVLFDSIPRLSKGLSNTIWPVGFNLGSSKASRIARGSA